MKRISLIIGCLVLLSITANAQNSGYKGKHFSFNYSLFTSVAYKGPNEFGNSGLFSFNTNHHFNLDAAIGRKVSMGFSFEYVHTRFSFKEDLHSFFYNPVVGRWQSTFVGSNSQGNIEVYSAGLYYRFFLGGGIAPLGTYIKPEFLLQWFKVYPGNPEYESSLPYFTEPNFTNHSPYFNYAILLEIGQNRIFFDRLIIDYGCRLGFMPRMTQYGNIQLDERNYLEVEPMNRLIRHYLFNVKAGVGVLLF